MEIAQLEAFSQAITPASEPIKSYRASAFAAALMLGAAYWVLLPAVQKYVMSEVPAGKAGPWLVRPVTAFHFGAMAIMTCVTIPVIVAFLRWMDDDARVSSAEPYDHFAGRPIARNAFMVKGIWLAIVYGVSLVFYLSSWVTIGPDGIEQHLPWAIRHYSFNDIVSLETIPEGCRSDAIRQDGPWYSATLKTGRQITWSLDNEGSSQAELKTIAAYVAGQSGRPWKFRSDLHR